MIFYLTISVILKKIVPYTIIMLEYMGTASGLYDANFE